jgi:hypothetical protein
MGVGKLWARFRRSDPALHAKHGTVNNSVAMAHEVTIMADANKSATLPPRYVGRKLSKKQLAKQQKEEEEALRRAKAEEEETMSQYLGKSSSTNSLPRVLSQTSLSRCATPERSGRKDVMVKFDEEGNIILRNRPGSFGSEASCPISTPSSVMGTPERSDREVLAMRRISGMVRPDVLFVHRLFCVDRPGWHGDHGFHSKGPAQCLQSQI